jgi:hypothetical protein
LVDVPLGFLAAAIFLSIIEEALSITLIIFVLVILLFGFEGQDGSRARRHDHG